MRNALRNERPALRLYRTHRDTLVSYAGRLSGDRTMAEDIVQDAWMLLDRQPESSAIREPLSYLRRIIRNLVFADARRQRAPAFALQDLPEIGDERPTAEAQVMARQAMALVIAAIDDMPARQRAAIEMYHFEDMKLREVAHRLGLSLSYTHSLIVDGMAICNQRRRQGL